MHLSTAGQLAHPAEDGGRRAGRNRDRIVTNGHGLPGRKQSDNGGVRPYKPLPNVLLGRLYTDTQK